MAEISSNEERQRAERNSPSEPAPASTGHDLNPGHSPKSTRLSRLLRLRRPIRSIEAIHSKHFTLHAGLASTKKQELRLAFGVRAGASSVRNRAKRQARETFRLNRHKLPERIDIVIATRGDISSLTRREMREQLTALFGRASTLSPPPGPGEASRR